MYFDKVINLIIALNVLFTGTVLTLNAFDHTVSGELIIGWFAFTGTELISMAAITRSGHKHKKGVCKNEKTDE